MYVLQIKHSTKLYILNFLTRFDFLTVYKLPLKEERVYVLFVVFPPCNDGIDPGLMGYKKSHVSGDHILKGHFSGFAYHSWKFKQNWGATHLLKNYLLKWTYTNDWSS